MAWCYQVGVNLARSAARRRSVEQKVLRRVAADAIGVDRAEALSEALAVRCAVLELPTRQRQAIVARYYLGLSVRETAGSMRCAAGTVTALTHQAITSLRRSPLLAGPDTYQAAEHERS